MRFFAITATVVFLSSVSGGSVLADGKEMSAVGCVPTTNLFLNSFLEDGQFVFSPPEADDQQQVECPIVRDSTSSKKGVKVTVRATTAGDSQCGVRAYSKFGEEVGAAGDFFQATGAPEELKFSLKSNPKKAFFVLMCEFEGPSTLHSYRYSE